MKIWKLVSGIISIVVFIIITFQSCATGVVNVLEDNETDMSAEGGIFVAFVLLVAGIVSACVWKNASRGGRCSSNSFVWYSCLIWFYESWNI